jgi:hypothetical protein
MRVILKPEFLYSKCDESDFETEWLFCWKIKTRNCWRMYVLFIITIRDDPSIPESPPHYSNKTFIICRCNKPKARSGLVYYTASSKYCMNGGGPRHWYVEHIQWQACVVVYHARTANSSKRPDANQTELVAEHTPKTRPSSHSVPSGPEQ